MKRLVLLLVTLTMFLVVCPVFGQTPEDEQIAKALYLKASKAIRAEEYQEAVKLLTQILDEYPDSEVALRADEKLSDIIDKAKLSNLPKTPGFYLVEVGGKISGMAKREISEGAPYSYDAEWATFSKELIPEIFADELEKFIVYSPKSTLQDVYWTYLSPYMMLVEKGKYEPTGDFDIMKEWDVPSVVGESFGSSKVVFEEIKPGMWEVGFPTVFSPKEPVLSGLVDGGSKVGLIVVLPKMVHFFYRYLELWESEKIKYASSIYVSRQLKKYPENPDLLFFDAILKYKVAYKQDEPQTEALAITRRAIELSQQNKTTPKVVSDLNTLLEYCLADSIVRANSIEHSDSPEVRSQKHSALLAFYSDKVPAELFWVQTQIARNLAFVGEFDEAILLAEKTVKAFKKKRPDTGKSIFGIKVKAEIGKLSYGVPKEPEAFDIHDALTCYTLNPEWERIKNLKKEIESEQFLSQALELIEANGPVEEIERALKSAKSKNKNNIYAYETMVAFYAKIDKQKDSEKAQKDITKANKRLTKLSLERKSS
jgi:tetratricopeptide (TPR) repeat protein